MKTANDLFIAKEELNGILSLTSILCVFGPFLLAWFSDIIGRKKIILILLISQAILYSSFPHVSNFTFSIIIIYCLQISYIGVFAIIPAFIADSYGPTNIYMIYGTILTAWVLAMVVGPQLFLMLKGISYYSIAILMMLGFSATLLFYHLRPKSPN